MALIELENIVKTYDLGHQKVPALRSIDVRIEDGKVVQFRARVALSFKYDASA